MRLQLSGEHIIVFLFNTHVDSLSISSSNTNVLFKSKEVQLTAYEGATVRLSHSSNDKVRQFKAITTIINSTVKYHWIEIIN